MASPEPPSTASHRPVDADLERGPTPSAQRHSMISNGTSSSSSSIRGDPDQHANDGQDDEWGPQHPCYPHLNPHVPLNSAEYKTTRIIRIRRDWLVSGDLAPTFSNVWPETLETAGMSEDEFRRVIDKLNTELVATFNPTGWQNVLDGFMGLATGWFWEDMGLTSAKRRLRRLEKWIDDWNVDMVKTWAGGNDGTSPPKIMPLRRTAYMSLDIQIFDPEITHLSTMERSSTRSRSPRLAPVRETSGAVV